VHIAVVVDAFGPGLDAEAAAAAVAAGWRAAAPEARLTVLAPTEIGHDVDLVVTGVARFDWQALRDSLVTAAAGVAVQPRGAVRGPGRAGERRAAGGGRGRRGRGLPRSPTSPGPPGGARRTCRASLGSLIAAGGA
jgi:hypothetical protein